MIIKETSARKVKDSRDKITIEVSVNGCTASSPSGKSTGKYESKPYYNFIEWNIDFLNKFHSDIKINSFNDLKKIEDEIKKKTGFKDVKEFGANALFAFESAILKALAKEKNVPLWKVISPKARKFPVPVGNAIGGGLHSHLPGHPEFQEFLIIPKGNSFSENVSIMDSIYSDLQGVLNSRNINDEGAWETTFSNEDIFLHLIQFNDIANFGLDVASSSFYKDGKYNYKNKVLSREAQIDHMNFLIDTFKIFYCEDPLYEEDFEGFSKIKRKNNLIVGDDLTATHIERLRTAIKKKSINAMIIKPNQNGSLIELKQIIDLCKKNRIKTIFSHRSGETMDSAIADYALGFQTDFIKTGIATPWRRSKLQRLIDIEGSFD